MVAGPHRIVAATLPLGLISFVRPEHVCSYRQDVCDGDEQWCPALSLLLYKPAGRHVHREFQARPEHSAMAAVRSYNRSSPGMGTGTAQRPEASSLAAVHGC